MCGNVCMWGDPKRNGISNWTSTRQCVPSAGSSSVVKKLPAFMEAYGWIPTTVPYSERDECTLSLYLLIHILILYQYRSETFECHGQINIWCPLPVLFKHFWPRMGWRNFFRDHAQITNNLRRTYCVYGKLSLLACISDYSNDVSTPL